MTQDPDRSLGNADALPQELGYAGAITDKAIEHMLGRDLPPLAIASALLGGALGLLSRTMDQRAMVRMLENAIVSVRSGELHPDRDREAGRAMGAPEDVARDVSGSTAGRRAPGPESPSDP